MQRLGQALLSLGHVVALHVALGQLGEGQPRLPLEVLLDVGDYARHAAALRAGFRQRFLRFGVSVMSKKIVNFFSYANVS